jgi:hypothetical protein
MPLSILSSYTPGPRERFELDGFYTVSVETALPDYPLSLLDTATLPPFQALYPWESQSRRAASMLTIMKLLAGQSPCHLRVSLEEGLSQGLQKASDLRDEVEIYCLTELSGRHSPMETIAATALFFGGCYHRPQDLSGSGAEPIYPRNMEPFIPCCISTVFAH